MSFRYGCISFAVTNGKHQWVPKDIAEAAEKYAKVRFTLTDYEKLQVPWVIL